LNFFKLIKLCCLFLILTFVGACSDSTSTDTQSGSSSIGKYWVLQSDSAEFDLRMDHRMVVFKDKVWLVAGIKSNNEGKVYYNDVWCSADGVTFLQEQYNSSFSHRSGHDVVVFEDKLVVVAGFSVTQTDLGPVTSNVNDVWASEDGVTWTNLVQEAAFPSRNGHQVVVSDNKMWMFAGFDESTYYKDIWTSTDGINWVRQSNDASFSYRAGHQVVMFNSMFWLIGGVYDSGDTRTYYNDVWNSSDGINWTKVGEFSDDSKERYFHQVVVYDNKMWIIGATNYDLDTKAGATYYNDVYSSDDGFTWTEVTEFSASKFSARGRHQVVVFKDAFWLYGGQTGYESTNEYEIVQKDIWKSY